MLRALQIDLIEPLLEAIGASIRANNFSSVSGIPAGIFTSNLLSLNRLGAFGRSAEGKALIYSMLIELVCELTLNDQRLLNFKSASAGRELAAVVHASSGAAYAYNNAQLAFCHLRHDVFASSLALWLLIYLNSSLFIPSNTATL